MLSSSKRMFTYHTIDHQEQQLDEQALMGVFEQLWQEVPEQKTFDGNEVLVRALEKMLTEGTLSQKEYEEELEHHAKTFKEKHCAPEVLKHNDLAEAWRDFEESLHGLAFDVHEDKITHIFQSLLLLQETLKHQLTKTLDKREDGRPDEACSFVSHQLKKKRKQAQELSQQVTKEGTFGHHLVIRKMLFVIETKMYQDVLHNTQEHIEKQLSSMWDNAMDWASKQTEHYKKEDKQVFSPLSSEQVQAGIDKISSELEKESNRIEEIKEQLTGSHSIAQQISEVTKNWHEAKLLDKSTETEPTSSQNNLHELEITTTTPLGGTLPFPTKRKTNRQTRNNKVITQDPPCKPEHLSDEEQYQKMLKQSHAENDYFQSERPDRAMMAEYQKPKKTFWQIIINFLRAIGVLLNVRKKPQSIDPQDHTANTLEESGSVPSDFPSDKKQSKPEQQVNAVIDDPRLKEAYRLAFGLKNDTSDTSSPSEPEETSPNSKTRTTPKP